jgi:hypothetical protein
VACSGGCAHTSAVLIFIREHAAVVGSFGVVWSSAVVCCVTPRVVGFAVFWEKAGCWQYMQLSVTIYAICLSQQLTVRGSVCGRGVQGGVWRSPGGGGCCALHDTTHSLLFDNSGCAVRSRLCHWQKLCHTPVQHCAALHLTSGSHPARLYLLVGFSSLPACHLAGCSALSADRASHVGFLLFFCEYVT